MELSAANQNERHAVLPMIDHLQELGIQIDELLADRGYAGRELEQDLRDREITPRISQPRRAGQKIAPGTPTREVWRGRRRRLKTADPQARLRWPIERTNAWLKSKRRIATRYDHKPENYLAFVKLGMILILHQSF